MEEASNGKFVMKQTLPLHNLVVDAHKFVNENQQKDHALEFARDVYMYHNRLEKGAIKTMTTKQTKEAPPLLPDEIMRMIVEYFQPTVFDVLEGTKRTLKFIDTKEKKDMCFFGRQLMLKAFPSIGELDRGYKFYDGQKMSSYKNGKLSVRLEQHFKNDGAVKREPLGWNVTVDLGKVIVPETQKRVSFIDIPHTAVTVSTNVRRLNEQLKLKQARIEEMEGFRLKGKITNGGKRIRLESMSTGVDSDLGFDIVVGFPFLPGRQLKEHGGFAVGDRVRLETCYVRYNNFALGQVGVIRDIRMFSFALCYVELADKDASISQRVVDTHKKHGGMHEGQLEHWVPCQQFHLKPVGSAGGVGGVA